jgi:hypothetical protein
MRRIENAVSEGDFDVDGVFLGEPFALELKVAKRPARRTTKLRFGEPIKDTQEEWGRERLEAGGAAAYLIQVGEGHAALRYLVRASYGARLQAGVTEEELDALACLCDTAAETIQLAVRMKEQKR